MKINQIEITAKATILRMTYSNAAKVEKSAGVHSPAHSDAFTLYNEDFTESYKLLEVLSVATDTLIKVPPGGSLAFTLTFERVPDTVARLNLLEGKGVPEKGRIASNFYDIQLIAK